MRRHHQEGALHGIGRAIYGNLAFFHGLQQRCLGLGRRPVDLVGQHDLSHDRTGAELELHRLLVKDRHTGNVGRQHIRGELDAAELATDGARDRTRQHRLAHAGNILDQQMSFAQQRQQRGLYFDPLADDDRLDIVADTVRNGFDD